MAHRGSQTWIITVADDALRVAPSRWSDDAKTLLDFLYRFWGEQRRPPNLNDIHSATGMGLRETRRTFRELATGFAVAFGDGTLNLNLAKVTPFSATPTPVYFEHEGRFHSYVGCPAEALTVSAMPMFCESVLTVRSSCECCFEPIELQIQNMTVLSTSPVEPLVSFVGSPYEWEHGVPPDRVCDCIHFVIDESHARRYEHQIARRGTTVTIDQLLTIGTGAAKGRMWDRDWPPMWMDAQAMVRGFAAVGVDVSAWR
jgi:hypothetical protein